MCDLYQGNERLDLYHSPRATGETETTSNTMGRTLLLFLSGSALSLPCPLNNVVTSLHWHNEVATLTFPSPPHPHPYTIYPRQHPHTHTHIQTLTQAHVCASFMCTGSLWEHLSQIEQIFEAGSFVYSVEQEEEEDYWRVARLFAFLMSWVTSRTCFRVINAYICLMHGVLHYWMWSNVNHCNPCPALGAFGPIFLCCNSRQQATKPKGANPTHSSTFGVLRPLCTPSSEGSIQALITVCLYTIQQPVHMLHIHYSVASPANSQKSVTEQVKQQWESKRSNSKGKAKGV